MDYNEFMSTQMVCPNCNHFYDKNYTSCPTCGVPLISNDEWSKLKDPSYASKPQSTSQYQPRCPACGSPNVEKISTASKVGAGIAFGVFSLGHISKTFKCKNCGYKF
jgi:RNA polymerase subunit RPABC4/transcription elongation factor Spt4